MSWDGSLGENATKILSDFFLFQIIWYLKVHYLFYVITWYKEVSWRCVLYTGFLLRVLAVSALSLTIWEQVFPLGGPDSNILILFNDFFHYSLHLLHLPGYFSLPSSLSRLRAGFCIEQEIPPSKTARVIADKTLMMDIMMVCTRPKR